MDAMQSSLRAALLTERDEKIVAVTEDYAQILGYRAEDLLNEHVSVVVGEADRARLLEFGKRRLRGEGVPTRYEFRARMASGTLVPVLANIAVSAEEQTIVTRIISFADLSTGTDAFERLYDAYSSSIYGLALELTRDLAAAQDIRQETFAQVWAQRERYDSSKGSLLGWISVIARTRAIDMLRRSRRQAAVPLDGNLTASEIPVEALLIARADHQLIHEILLELPEKQRLVIELAYFGGMSHSAIARDLNEPLGTVKTRTKLALKKLRAALDRSQRSSPG